MQQVRSGNVNGKTWVVPDILSQRLPRPENHSMGLSTLRATLDRPSYTPRNNKLHASPTDALAPAPEAYSRFSQRCPV